MLNKFTFIAIFIAILMSGCAKKPEPIKVEPKDYRIFNYVTDFR